jgi:type III pantothenate kinase
MTQPRMTLLAIDVGNRETAIGLVVRGELEAEFTAASDVLRTADEWFLVVDGLVERSGLPDVGHIAVSSTVPSILTALRECFDRHYVDVPVWVVGPGVKTGVAIHTDNPKEVGTDRIVRALAAKEIYGGPVVVVALTGTATVVDAIDEDGRFLGGAIAPGMEVALEALASGGAQLRSIEPGEPRGVIGKNTVDAINAGTVYGYAGLVDALVGRILDDLDLDPEHVTVVATGAHGDVVVEHCETVTTRDRHLSLRGLTLVAEKNG